MALSNKERIGRALELLERGLPPFVERQLKQVFGGYWIEKGGERTQLRVEDGAVRWDAQSLFKVMLNNWAGVFGKTLGHAERAYAGELVDFRNKWAHGDALSSDDTHRALDTAERLLRSIAASAEADDVAKLRIELQRTVFTEQARQQTRRAVPIEGSPRAGLKPWREVVTPHRDVASGRYMQAEFAADLAQVHRGDADTSEEYRDPVEFFGRTFITDGLRDLLAGALRRLTGGDADPVVELQTNFGGGKTHSMLALYHLFGAADPTKLPGIEPVLKEAGVERVPKARRAVLVGTALAPAEVRKKPDGTEVRTTWGELAWQLGAKQGYKLVAESDRKGTSPGSDLLTQLFRQFGPALVLIDEWVAYARLLVDVQGLPAGTFESQASFVQSLTEAAKAVPGTLVVASIPASRIEIGGQRGEFALDALTNVFQRAAKPWRPATSEEGFEIVRRRLFEPMKEKDDFAARDATVEAFAKMYREAPGEFPQGCTDAGYRRDLERAYPLHPELFRRLYDDWSTLDKFQRTRGVLRLLAKVIHRLWEGQDAGLLIMPASIPLDDPSVTSELTRYLEDVWEPILSQDVDGPNSLPLKLDGETPNLGRYSACRRVARALYIGTAPGSTGKSPGVDDRGVRLACAQPGESVATFGDALRRLGAKAYHIHQDGSRYWLSTRRNLNRQAEDEAARLLRSERETLEAAVAERLRKDKRRGDFAGLHACPESVHDVHDEPEARLVILGPQHPHRKGQADSVAMNRAREFLESRGGGPRLNRNMLVFLAADERARDDLLQAVADHLAWQSIEERREELDIGPAQQTQVAAKLKSADETVQLRIGSTWTHLLVPHQAEPTGEVKLDELRATANGALAERVSTKLKTDELLLTEMAGNRLRMALDKGLWAGKDHVRFGDVAEYFARYLYLPRVLNRDVLVEAVRDGAKEMHITDTFAVAAGYDEAAGRYRGLRQGGAVGIVIDNDTLLVKPEAAAKQQPSLRPTPPPGAPGGSGTGARPDAPPGTAEQPPAAPTLFVGSVRLNPTRIGRDAGTIAEEVVQHLSTLPGAEAEVTLEIQVRVPGGIDDKTVRDVTENANTLRFRTHGFEKG